jgi:hypothetical protein
VQVDDRGQPAVDRRVLVLARTLDSNRVQAIVLAARRAASTGRELAVHPVMARQARKLFKIARLNALLAAAG